MPRPRRSLRNVAMSSCGRTGKTCACGSGSGSGRDGSLPIMYLSILSIGRACAHRGAMLGTCFFCNRAHGVVVSHPLSMREALGSIPSVSIWILWRLQRLRLMLRKMLHMHSGTHHMGMRLLCELALSHTVPPGPFSLLHVRRACRSRLQPIAGMFAQLCVVLQTDYT